MRAIVFMLRGCPAGWLGAYGNEWIGTPHLDRLASESVVFDRHISDCPERDAALRAWLGGAHPSGSRLTEALRSGGIRTVLVRANHPDTDGPDWFYAGWDEVFDARPQEEDNSPLDALVRSFPKLLDRLSNVRDYLLGIDIDRLLAPWDVPQEVFEAYFEADADEEAESDEEDTEEREEDEMDESESDDNEDEEDSVNEDVDETEEVEQDTAGLDSPLTTHHSPSPGETVPPWSDPPTGPFDNTDADAREWLHDSFAAVITTLDAELGHLFDQLRGRGLDQSAAWLVTSDFGYPLGGHGQLGLHRPWLYEELVHLPLILRLPGAEEACHRVWGFTQPPDLAPTLLNLFGVAANGEAFEGHNLLPLARGQVESVRPHAITSLEVGAAAERAIRTDEWAYLLPVRVPEGETREPQLFQKPDDRWEVNDLRARNIERADELEAELTRRAADERR
jgi:arylsulfatase A-like enzyme